MRLHARRIEVESDLHAQVYGDTGQRREPVMNFDKQELDLLVAEFNHRIRNLLAVIQVLIGQTQSATVDEYRSMLSARISAFRLFYEMVGRMESRQLGLAELLEQTMRPYCTMGTRVLALGTDLELQPKLALALHLVFHELATNASKYGALSSQLGRVRIEWKIRQVADAGDELAIVWSEHGGPEVTPPRHQGFGSRLIKRALDGYGAARLDFRPTGLACFILLDLERRLAPTHSTL
jgi:two-component sensor histidine kinase